MNNNPNLKAADSQIDYSSVNLRLTHLKLITWVINTESEGEMEPRKFITAFFLQ